MKKLFSIIFLLLCVFGLFIDNVEAARFGSGRSIGMHRSFSGHGSSAFSSARPASVASAATNPVASKARSWLGPLAGLAAGGLLAYLFMGHGLASGMLSWIVIAAIGLFIFNLLRRKFIPQTEPFVQPNQSNVAAFTPANTDQYRATPSVGNDPLGFDSELFLREAKVRFIRLQADFDNKNLQDIREFTTPEVFAEIQMQFQERGNAINQTEVVSLEAKLLEMSDELQGKVASVYFSGLIKENGQQDAAPFKEIWHFLQAPGQIWVVAGIQQE